MDLPITNLDIVIAQAQGLQQMIATFFPFIILFVVLYFLFIRPEQKRARQHRELVQKLKAGDKIVTNSGIHGTIKGVQQQTITLSIAEGTDITLEKASVARIESAGGE